MKINFFIVSSLFFFALFGNTHQIVNLASFPRSGNHWVRFLIEETTNISTSSSYKDGDFKHIKNPYSMPGFSVKNGYFGNCHLPLLTDPLLLKTHYPWFDEKNFTCQNQPTVCLIRHPIDSIHSYYQYMKKRNPKAVPETFDNQFIRLAMAGWLMFYNYWEKQPDVLIIRYEDLLRNTEEVLKSILDKVGFTFKEEDIKRAIRKHAPFGHPFKHLANYNSSQIDIIKEMAGEKISQYEYPL